MRQSNYLFIDRDGTLIVEPEDQQVDSIEKLELMPGIFTALGTLIAAGFKLVMVTNQDGLGSNHFKRADFDAVQQLLLKLFKSQGIVFESIKICPHWPSEDCECRKPKLGLVMDYLVSQSINKARSFMIGDRNTDALFAKNLGIEFIGINQERCKNWDEIATYILNKPRTASVHRKTQETDIRLSLNLDYSGEVTINTGIHFFDHMLDQLAKHADISLSLNVLGDIHVDDHHTVEDVAIVLGQGIAQSLGQKRGIDRYGFLLPMDESVTQMSIDLSGRPYCCCQVTFTREKVGDFSTELVKHFFSSFADGLRATLHLNIEGDNTHHMIESAFKCLGRVLRQAIKRVGHDLPSTKGVL